MDYCCFLLLNPLGVITCQDFLPICLFTLLVTHLKHSGICLGLKGMQIISPKKIKRTATIDGALSSGKHESICWVWLMLAIAKLRQILSLLLGNIDAQRLWNLCPWLSSACRGLLCYHGRGVECQDTAHSLVAGSFYIFWANLVITQVHTRRLGQWGCTLNKSAVYWWW